MIRDQLYIKKDLGSFNPYSSRKGYMDKSFPASKRYPSLSYAAFANSMELRLDAKRIFFERRHFRYSGWGMDKDWDHKLKKEEKEQKAKGNKAYRIGDSLDERLLQASLRELSYKPSEPRLRKCLKKEDKPDKPTTSTSKAVKQGKKETQTNRKGDNKEKRCWRYKESELYLPVNFHWEKMETTTGFPPLKADEAHVC